MGVRPDDAKEHHTPSQEATVALADEIRCRIERGVYDHLDVIEETARRILESGDL